MASKAAMARAGRPKGRERRIMRPDYTRRALARASERRSRPPQKASSSSRSVGGTQAQPAAGHGVRGEPGAVVEFRQVDVPECVGRCEQAVQKAVVVAMSGPGRGHAGQHRRSGQIEVADAIEHLVAHELVFEPQALVVEDAIAADADGVLERATAGEAGGAQAVDVLDEAEGAGARDLGLERLRRHVQAAGLPGHRGEAQIELEMERQAAAAEATGNQRCQAHPAIILDDADLAPNLDAAAGGRPAPSPGPPTSPTPPPPAPLPPP